MLASGDATRQRKGLLGVLPGERVGEGFVVGRGMVPYWASWMLSGNRPIKADSKMLYYNVLAVRVLRCKPCLIVGGSPHFFVSHTMSSLGRMGRD